MCIDERMILCGSAWHSGADCAILQSDDKTLKWFRDNFNIDVETIEGDADAAYAKVLKYNASDFVPMVTYPPEVYTCCPVKERQGIAVDQCLMGTCAGGSYEDLRIAAEILKGRKVYEGVRFVVSPATKRIYVQAAKDGLLATLADAGAIIYPPTCDICVGTVAPLSAGEVGLSQQTTNAPGRSGSREAQIYLASASTIAASAVTGRITDPRDLLKGEK